MHDFDGRVAVVTGAASGIGLALARRFAAEGMQVVLADIQQEALERACAELQENGREAVCMRVDVSDPAQVDALADLAYERFGAVHVLCNNAGVLPPGRFRPVWEFALEDWKLSFDVNVMGVVHGLRSFMPRMLAAGQAGHVVNTSSIGGLTSGTYSAVYGSAKHAVVRITEALYGGLAGSRIGVTAFCPGLVSSGMAQGDALLSADEAVGMLVDAIRENTLYLLTSDAYDGAIRERADHILARRNPVFADVRDLNQLEVAARA